MEQDYKLELLGNGNDGIPTRPTPLSHPLTRTPTSFDHRITIDDEPELVDSSDDEDAVDDHSSYNRGCGYSKSFVFLDMIWNLAFVLVSLSVLLTTIQERPSTPLRLWIGGYALQCLLHVGFVWTEYQRRSPDDFDDVQGFSFGVFSFSSMWQNSIIKKLESVNTVVSSIWWVFGFYWIVLGGQTLLENSPRLYWLSVVFLAFDVFFMIFCVAMACIIFFVLFCFFPILATVAYAMTIGEGASESDIRVLPKYRYRQFNSLRRFETDWKETNLSEGSGGSDVSLQLSLKPEDSECCICLYNYVDGVELCTLPCNHNFHHKCICKWLRINATCPLCKLNILRGETLA